MKAGLNLWSLLAIALTLITGSLRGRVRLRGKRGQQQCHGLPHW